MQVKIGNKIYQMPKEKAQELRKMASEQVPLGIYAVEKKNYLELRCDKCKSMTQLKQLIRDFKQQGFQVYMNKGDVVDG